MIMQEPTTTKPIVKVTVEFQRVGTSENPEKLTEGLQRAFGYELILRQARVFSDRNQAMAYENKLQKKYAAHRIPPPRCGQGLHMTNRISLRGFSQMPRNDANPQS